MANIGAFKSNGTGFEGTIRTLTLQTDVKIVANDKKNGEKSPDFFVKAGDSDIGAAWRMTSKGDDPIDYLSVSLDDPSFSEPIRAALFEKNGRADLVWDRKRHGDE